MSPDRFHLLAELERLAVPRQLPIGAVLFRPGQPAIGAWVVRSGRIAVLWTSDRMIRRVSTARPGDLLGLVGALTGAHTVTARAASKTTLGLVPLHQLHALLQRDPIARQAALAHLADELACFQSFVAAHSARLVASAQKRPAKSFLISESSA